MTADGEHDARKSPPRAENRGAGAATFGKGETPILALTAPAGVRRRATLPRGCIAQPLSGWFIR
jgi:hypothetical protein